MYRLPTTDRADRIEIYSSPNFQGRVAKYAGPIDNFNYPLNFKHENLSLKVAPGYIAIIEFKDAEFPFKAAFYGNYANFGSKYKGLTIKSIRIDKAKKVAVNLSGFSTQIHNNDCKRVFGSVKLTLSDDWYGVVYPNIEFQGRPLSASDVNGYRNTGSDIRMIVEPVPLFERSNDFSRPNLFEVRAINYDGRTIPAIRSTAFTQNPLPVSRVFVVSERTYNADLITVVITSDLGTQHKNCDLCTDYSSSVKMKTPVTHQVKYKDAETYFYVGPFDLKGAPDRDIAASGGINKKLVLHLNKETPPPSRP